MEAGSGSMRTARGLAVALCVIGGLLGGAPAASAATGVQTVSWAADDSADGSGTGTLAEQTVTYSTIAFGTGGTSVALDWNTAPGTDDAVGTGVSSQTAGVMAVGVSAGTNVNFSSTVVDPIVYAALGDPVTYLDFGDVPFTVLDANHATRNGTFMQFDNAAADTPADSFAVRLHGTFGPGSPLLLLYYNDSGTSPATMAFTIGVTDATPPTVTITSPADGARFGLLQILLQRPRARFSCADDVAVATCSATVDGRPIADGAPLPATFGAHTLTVTATDDAGNTHSETRSYRVALL
jgi:hypothetical protein